jgi:hypothetical protein
MLKMLGTSRAELKSALQLENTSAPAPTAPLPAAAR